MPELTGNFDTGKLPRIAQGSVTVTIARTVEPGHDARFLAWSHEMLTAVQAAEGCLGAMTLRPGTDSDEYHMVFRFVDVMHLRRWERSPKREELLGLVDDIIKSERITVTPGTDQFFNAQSESQPHKSRARKFLADTAWVYPVALGFTVIVAPYIGNLDLLPRVLISTLFVGATSKYATEPVRRWWRRRKMLPQGVVLR